MPTNAMHRLWSDARDAAVAVREGLDELPEVAVGAPAEAWSATTTALRMRAGDLIRAIRALRASARFGELLAFADEAASEVDSALDQVRSRSLPGLLEAIGTLIDPSVGRRERNRVASRFHLPVERLQDDLTSLVEALDAAPPEGGDAGG